MPNDRVDNFKKFSDSLAVLAEKAAPKNGLQKMDEGKDKSERDRFDANLNEAALAFCRAHASSLSPADKKRIGESVARNSKKAAEEVSQLVRAENAPKPLLRAQEDLHRLADQFKEYSQLMKVKRGPRQTKADMTEIIYWLASAWVIGARRSPGTSSDSEWYGRAGPFVDFVEQAFTYFDPEGLQKKRASLGQTIQRCLREMKEKEILDWWGDE